MTFHGKTEEARTPRRLRNFAYRVYDGGIEHFVSSHDVYFYEAGRVGFWNDDENGERILVLTTKAFQVRQVVTKQ